MSRRSHFAQWLAIVWVGVFVLTPFAFAAQPVGTPAGHGTKRQPVAMFDRTPLLSVPELASPEGQGALRFECRRRASG